MKVNLYFTCKKSNWFLVLFLYNHILPWFRRKDFRLVKEILLRSLAH